MQAGRTFAVDMAGFAVNTDVVQAYPEATIPWRISYLEDGFLKSLKLKLRDLEPLANSCKDVLVWHTKTSKAASPKAEDMKNIQLPERIQSFDETNLVDLYAGIVI